MGLASNLKRLRKDACLTQKELAEKLGLSLSSIISYENGVRSPNAKALVKLESYFQVNGEYLFSEYRPNEIDNYM